MKLAVISAAAVAIALVTATHAAPLYFRRSDVSVPLLLDHAVRPSQPAMEQPSELLKARALLKPLASLAGVAESTMKDLSSGGKVAKIKSSRDSAFQPYSRSDVSLHADDGASLPSTSKTHARSVFTQAPSDRDPLPFDLDELPPVSNEVSSSARAAAVDQQSWLISKPPRPAPGSVGKSVPKHDSKAFSSSASSRKSKSKAGAAEVDVSAPLSSLPVISRAKAWQWRKGKQPTSALEQARSVNAFFWRMKRANPNFRPEDLRSAYASSGIELSVPVAPAAPAAAQGSGVKGLWRHDPNTPPGGDDPLEQYRWYNAVNARRSWAKKMRRDS